MEDLKHLREVLTEAYPREELSLDALARVLAALDGLPAAALDGGWTFKGFTAWAQALEADAKRYRWLRDRNDWYAEPRIDEHDGTKWELVFYSPQRIEDPTDDDNLDAAVDAAMAEAPVVGAA